MNEPTTSRPGQADQGKGTDPDKDSTVVVHVEKIEDDDSAGQADTGKPAPRGPDSVGSSMGGKTANELKGGEGDEDSASE